MKKRIISLILVVATLLGMVPTTVFAANETAKSPNPFKDVKKDSWYYEDVVYVREKGIFSGLSDTAFGPEDPLTRGMFVTVLGRMAGVDQAGYTRAVFDDVDPLAWYGPYVAWAAESGITAGTGAGLFSPDAYVTREQIATFLYRFLQFVGCESVTAADLTYADQDSIASYAREAVGVCLAMELMKGDNRNNFRPKDSATRAEAAAICARVHRQITEAPEDNEDNGSTPDIPFPNLPNYPGQGGGDGSEDSVVTFFSVKIGIPASMSEEDIAATVFPPEQMVLSGDLVYSLPVPYREGYIFAGWYYDSALAVIADTDDTVTENLTVYPRLVKEDDAAVLGDGALNYVAAIDVDTSYRVTVQAPSASAVINGITFINVSDGNEEVPFTVSSNGDGTYTVHPVEGLMAGKTYQLTATDRETLVTPENPCPMDDEYILFIHEGEVQRKEVRYYNIFTYREEEENLRIDDSVIFLDLGLTSGFGMDEAAGLYSVALQDNGEFSLVDNDAEGSFVYEGTPALKVGDIVAIHTGGVDEETRTMSDDAEVAYIEITRVDGTTYYYVSAQAADVMFIPDVIPVPIGADMDGDSENDTITVDSDMLDFTLFENQEVLNSDTVVGVDDYLALYEGALSEAAEATYVRITAMEEGDGTVTFTVVPATLEEIQSALNTYTINNVDVNLPEDQIVHLENQLVEQATESGFAEEAAMYVLRNKLGIQETPVWGETYALTDEMIDALDIEVDGGNLMYQIRIGRPNVDANITYKLQKVTQVNDASGLRVAFGVTIPLGLEVVENGWHVVESITMDLYVTFEQEVAFNTRFSVDSKWKWYFIIPVLKEVYVDAGFEFGTYTGIGAIAIMATEKYYEKTYLWEELVQKEDGTSVFSSASSIATKLNDQLSRGDLSFFGDVGDEGELVEKYADMLQREIDYFDIFALPLFHHKGYMDKLHLVNYVLDIELIFAAKLNITMGMSFENLNVKQYSFHFELFSGKKSHNVVDKQTPYTNFNFFIFGNLGVRAGIGVTFAVGLISTKLDNIGVHIEVGPYLELYGFYYYHYDKIGSAKPNIKSGGAVYVEIGIYMALDFFAGAFLDLLSVEVHLVDESWKIFGAGTEWYPVKAEKPESSVRSYSGDSFGISDSYFKVREFNILTGEWRTVRCSIGDYNLVETRAVTGSGDTDKITYNPVTRRFEVDAELTDQELSADFTFVYKHGNPLIEPVTKTIHIDWIKTDPKFAVQYYTGHIVSYGIQDEWYPEIDDSLTEVFVAGSALPALPNNDYDCPGYDFVGWRIDCPSCPDIHGKMLHDVNYLRGYIMPEVNIGLEPVKTPRSDTPYTVRHLLESLDQPGEYEVIMEERRVGTTGASINEFTYLVDPGFRRDISKPQYSDIVYYEYQGKTYHYIWWETIRGDGSTVVDIYYTREMYAVGVHANNPAIKQLDDSVESHYYHSLAYGATIPDPGYSQFDSELCRFLGWSTSPDGPVEYTELPTVPGIVRPYMDFYAIWDFDDVEITINTYAYDPYAKEFSETPVYTEVRRVPFASKVLSYQFRPEDCPEISGMYVNQMTGHYNSDPEWAYTDDFINVNAYYEGVTFNLYCTGYFYQLVFGSDVQYHLTGAEITVPEGPEKEGYDFLGWKSSYRYATTIYQPGQTITVECSDYFVPEYAPADGTRYTVRHIREDLNGSFEGENCEVETEILYGTTDSKVTPAVRTYTGFVSPAAREVTIAADGSLVVEYRYERKTYFIHYNTDGGILRGTPVGFFDYGIPFSLTDTGEYTVTKEGYTFLGWYLSDDPEKTLIEDDRIDETLAGADSDLYLTALWQLNEVEYKVEHYLEQLDGSFVLQQTDTLSGLPGSTVTASEVEFAGFTCDPTMEGSVLTGTISKDGTTVFRLFYTRNSYTVTWCDYDGVTILGTASFLYGETIAVPDSVGTPEREAYRFDGWKDFGTMPAKDVTFSAAEYGNWTALTGPYDLTLNFSSGSLRYYDMFEGILTCEVEDKTYQLSYGESVYSIAQDTEIVAIIDAVNRDYPGYTFAGWYDAEGNLYDSETPGAMPAGNLTLTAKWQPMTVKVTFYSGSGYQSWGAPVGETFTRTYSYGDIITIPTDHGFTNDGYFISGWKIGDGSSGPGQGATINSQLVLIDGYNEYSITAGDEYGEMPAGEIWIFPVWTSDDDKCTVTFNGNGGIGTMDVQYIDGSGYNFTALNFNQFTRSGYRFIGWTTTPEYDPENDWLIEDGSGYIPDSSVESVTLYAQWEAVTESVGIMLSVRTPVWYDPESSVERKEHIAR